MGSWGRVVLGSVVLLTGCTVDGSATPAGAPATPPAASAAVSPPAGAATGCPAPVASGPLPDWADAGFYGDTRVPHVLGRKGEMVAVLFGNPLAMSHDDGRNNKILWVSRPAPGPSDPTASPDLTITATLDGTGTRVTREIAGGPGPSIVDVPRAGCWHLELRWSGRTDTVDLVYAER